MNVETLIAQAEQCRRNRKNPEDDYCVRPCPRCQRCRQYRANKQDDTHD